MKPRSLADEDQINNFGFSKPLSNSGHSSQQSCYYNFLGHKAVISNTSEEHLSPCASGSEEDSDKDFIEINETIITLTDVKATLVADNIVSPKDTAYNSIKSDSIKQSQLSSQPLSDQQPGESILAGFSSSQLITSQKIKELLTLKHKDRMKNKDYVIAATKNLLSPSQAGLVGLISSISAMCNQQSNKTETVSEPSNSALHITNHSNKAENKTVCTTANFVSSEQGLSGSSSWTNIAADIVWSSKTKTSNLDEKVLRPPYGITSRDVSQSNDKLQRNKTIVSIPTHTSAAVAAANQSSLDNHIVLVSQRKDQSEDLEKFQITAVEDRNSSNNHLKDSDKEEERKSLMSSFTSEEMYFLAGK